MGKASKPTKSEGEHTEKKIFKGKKRSKINPTPKKKKVPQPPPQKKKTPGFNEPFPATIDEQVERVNDVIRWVNKEKVDLELAPQFVKSSHFIKVDEWSFDSLRSNMIKTGLNYKQSAAGKTVRVLILTLSSERALELGELIEDAFDLPAKQHPILLASHGGGRKADQVTRQADALKKGDIPVAIGTPGRVMRLAQDGALDLALMAKEGAVVVFDMKYDSKQRDVLGMIEIKKDLAPLIGGPLGETLKAQGSKLKLAVVNKWDAVEGSDDDEDSSMGGDDSDDDSDAGVYDESD